MSFCVTGCSTLFNVFIVFGLMETGCGGIRVGLRLAGCVHDKSCRTRPTRRQPRLRSNGWALCPAWSPKVSQTARNIIYVAIRAPAQPDGKHMQLSCKQVMSCKCRVLQKTLLPSCLRRFHAWKRAGQGHRTTGHSAEIQELLTKRACALSSQGPYPRSPDRRINHIFYTQPTIIISTSSLHHYNIPLAFPLFHHNIPPCDCASARAPCGRAPGPRDPRWRPERRPQRASRPAAVR